MATLENYGSVESNQPTPAIPKSLLQEGQRLDQPTFHRLYLGMPDDFRAELIDEVVYLKMNVKARHGRADTSFQAILYYYSVETPGTIAQGNSTAILGPGSEVQPDVALLIDPAFGGRTRDDEDGYTVDAPELVVEISDSSLRLDLNAKKRVYEEAGAIEYVVFNIPNTKLHWFTLRDGIFENLPVDPDGLYHSRAFPGLWVDEMALVANDSRAVMAALRRGLDSSEHGEFVERLRQNRANRP